MERGTQRGDHPPGAPLAEPHTGRQHGRDKTRWGRSANLQLLGRVHDSGLQSDTYLVRRDDGQTVQLSALLYLVLQELSPDRDPAEIAAAVTRKYPRELTPDGLRHLLSTTLVRLGLAAPAVPNVRPEDPTPSTLPRAKPLLSLTLRGTLLPARITQRLAGTFGALFWTPIVCAAVVGWVAADVIVSLSAGHQGLARSVTDVFTDPPLLLALYATMTFTSLVHEMGHAAACRYGGAKPGRIGVGVYIVFLAFYTDVTDSYRLNRAGRLRTDLGGLYFNVLMVLVLASSYLISGKGFFLLILVLMQIEMAQQLIPLVRFDGYYILADLTGVPNLFARIRPSLLSLRPGRVRESMRESMDDLKPGARRLVRLWVSIVVPVLAFGFGWLLWNLPVIITSTMHAAGIQIDKARSAVDNGQISVLIVSILSVILLTLPLAGIGVIFWRIGVVIIGWVPKIISPAPMPRHALPGPPHHRNLTVPHSKSTTEPGDDHAPGLHPHSTTAPDRHRPLHGGDRRDDVALKPGRSTSHRTERIAKHALADVPTN